MPGIALEEASSCAKPLLQFFYQQSGHMLDVAELSFSVRDVTAATDRITDQAVDLDPCADGGHRLGLGRYVAAFTAAAADDFEVGTHEITWKFKPAVGDPHQFWRQRFEVLDAGVFPTGLGYAAYADSAQLAANSAFTAYTLGQIQEAAAVAAEEIERWTERFFEPRYLLTRYNATDAGALPLSHPIIGLDQVAIVSLGVAETNLTIDLTDLLVYNRHLSGLLDPDDRNNPRIEFATEILPGTVQLQGNFLAGRQNTLIGGVFGYTEPDGTAIGRRPRRLERVAGIMTLRQIQDPFGTDILTSSPGRIRKARTRDQAVEFGSTRDGGVGALTGDRTVDDILMYYRRPPYYGAVASG